MAEAISVEVTGIEETRKELTKLENALIDMSDANRKIASTLASKASALAPYRTGALAASVKGEVKDRKVYLSAGSEKVPYAGVIEYGWPQRNIQAQPYLSRAAYSNQDFIKKVYEEEIQQQVKKYNFD